MRLKIYCAATISEAMSQVRRELGPEALILSTRRHAQGVEVTAAHEQNDDDVLPRPQAAPDAEPGALRWHGIPDPIVRRLAAGPLPETLATLLRFGMLPLHGGAPLLLAGPPGAGKTLTTARLATRLVLAGTAPLIITADGRRAGAAEELAAYTRLLGISLMVANQPGTLARALQHRVAGAPVIIDTAGVNPFEAAPMAAIQALAATAQATQVLILPAGQDPAEAAEQAAAFSQAGARHFIPTRLDMCRRLGSVIAAAVAGSLVLSEAGTGAGATDGLTPLSPEVLVERLAQPGDTTATRKRSIPNSAFLAKAAHARPAHV